MAWLELRKTLHSKNHTALRIKKVVFEFFMAFCRLSSSSEGSFWGERCLILLELSGELLKPRLLTDINFPNDCDWLWLALESESPFWWSFDEEGLSLFMGGFKLFIVCRNFPLNWANLPPVLDSEVLLDLLFRSSPDFSVSVSLWSWRSIVSPKLCSLSGLVADTLFFPTVENSVISISESEPDSPLSSGWKWTGLGVICLSGLLGEATEVGDVTTSLLTLEMRSSKLWLRAWERGDRTESLGELGNEVEGSASSSSSSSFSSSTLPNPCWELWSNIKWKQSHTAKHEHRIFHSDSRKKLLRFYEYIHCNDVRASSGGLHISNRIIGFGQDGQMLNWQYPI